MKKNIILMTLILTLILFTSCIKNDSISSAGRKIYKIGMVTDVAGINDQSFNQKSWEGLKKLASDNPNVKVNYLESKSSSDYYPNLELFVDNEYDLIFSVGFNTAEALKEIAIDNPDSKFAIIDDESINLPNVANIVFAQEQASYLAGVVAAMMTKTNIIGYVQGMINDTLNRFGIGYIAGAKYINKDLIILQYNANSFTDASIGSSAATNMISKNADIIFHAAGNVGAGVISACAENKIYAIGVDSDQSYLAPNTVITSAIKNVDIATYEIADNIIKGVFKSGKNFYDINNNGVGIPSSNELLPQNVIDEVNQVMDEIKSGKLTVPYKVEDEPGFILAN